MTRGIMKCATCGETFGCDGPAAGPQYCSEECDPSSEAFNPPGPPGDWLDKTSAPDDP